LTAQKKWLGTLALLMLGASVSMVALAVESKSTDGVLVKTASGPVRGETEKGVFVFRGIRYAASPVRLVAISAPGPRDTVD
jgi:hypothetical protein